MNEIYCHRCGKFHPCLNPVSRDWTCPDCGTSLEQLYQEVREMPCVADRIYCMPDREREVEVPWDIRLLRFRHTTGRPALFEAVAILIAILLSPLVLAAVFLCVFVSVFFIVIVVGLYLLRLKLECDFWDALLR